eukprot:SAG11_NODE_975_length_6331_cov_4.407895_2_plen_1251_part_00
MYGRSSTAKSFEFVHTSLKFTPSWSPAAARVATYDGVPQHMMALLMLLMLARLALLCVPTSSSGSDYATSTHARVQRIRLNGEVAYDAGLTFDASSHTAAFAAPHGERGMLVSGALAGSERLGVVGPVAVQWSLAGGAAVHVSVSVRLSQTDRSHGSALEEVELAHAMLLPADARSWSCDEQACAMLRPHARHTLRVALHGAEGGELAAAACTFHAGPHGVAGDPAGGWTATWTGGASAIAAMIDLRPALTEGETLVQTTLHASSPQTMSWQLANGTRLHDSVLDPGYSNQPDMRSIYVAYDLSDFHSAGSVAITGHLGFGKYGYLGQWCNGAAHAMTASCKPVTAQVVSTTSTGRTLVVGTGAPGISELKGGAVIARWTGAATGAAASMAANTWRGRADGAPLMYSHLYHGEVYDATQETAGAPLVELQPWNTTMNPMGPLAPHAFPTIRPSEAAVDAVKAWVPPANASTGGPLSVVFDFGNNYAGSCELTVEGDTSALSGQSLRLRYGEVLLGVGADSEADGSHDVFHPWWPCVAPFSQGQHNCANQTDEYILRGTAGAVGPHTALGRVPMRTSSRAAIRSTTPPSKGAEVYMPSHAIKGGRWVQLNGTALLKLKTSSSLRFALPSGDACLPSGGTGYLVPCPDTKAATDVTITLRMWPLHSDVAARSGVVLHEAPPGERADESAVAWSVQNLNALQKMIVRTQLNNLHSVPQDCPHREQRGWGGDAQVTSGEASLNLDLSSFYLNWLTTMRDIQLAGCTEDAERPAPVGATACPARLRHPLGRGAHGSNKEDWSSASSRHGDLPSFVPSGGGWPVGDATWAAIGIVMPWEHLARSGDDTLTQLGYATTKSLLGFWQHHLDPTTGLLDIGFFGDWKPRCNSPAQSCPDQIVPGGEPGPNTLLSSHVTWIECLDRGVDLATKVRDTTQARAWAQQAAASRAAMFKLWWNETNGCFGSDCTLQTEQATLFALNVTGDDPRRTRETAALLASVEHFNTTFISGIVGTRWMPEALLNAKRGDVALALIGRDASAGEGTFSYMAKHGPGTLWEAWSGTPDSHDIQTGGSANHIMFGGGPGIFIHQAAGVPEGVWSSPDAEVAFALDGPTAVRLGGADVWSDGVLGEASLRWRLAQPAQNGLLQSELAEWRANACGAGRVLAVVVRGLSARADRTSWQLTVPVEVLGAANGSAVALAVSTSLGGVSVLANVARGTPTHLASWRQGVVVAAGHGPLTLRAADGVQHAFELCIVAA